KAGLNIAGTHFLLVAVLAGAGAFILAVGLLGSVWAGMAAMLVGVMAPRAWLNYQKSQRAQAFVRQLDSALGVACSALRAGASLSQAIAEVATAEIHPVSEEFARVDKAIRLGMSPAEAIQRIKERVECQDLDLVIVGTQIMTRTGGNLIQIYENAAQMVRERRAFRDAVRAYTAQPRLSAAIVSLMPVAMTLLVRALNPRYFEPMFRTVGGKAVFALCFGAIGVGWLVIQRIVSTSGVD
ncbi:MAG: type II secretion system F family protein, partial [Anaerolineae bacterium]